MASGSVIINAAWQAWYPLGQQRLLDSLSACGYEGGVLTWSNESINDVFDPACPYTIKAAALLEAMQQGWQRILWVDCSVWALKSPVAFLEMVQEGPGFFMLSGFNLAQTASDKALGHFGISRDEAERLPELASGIFGLNMGHARGRQLAELFIKSARDGVFHGSREHDQQSDDARFLFHRQDQTALSLCFHALGGGSLVPPSQWVWAAHEGSPAHEHVWALRGM